MIFASEKMAVTLQLKVNGAIAATRRDLSQVMSLLLQMMNFALKMMNIVLK